MKRIYFLLLFAGTLLAASCQDDWLDEKRNLSDVVPSSLKDFQALMDNTSVMNQNFPYMPLVCTDSYYLTQSQWLNGLESDRNAYVWAKDVLIGTPDHDWNAGYQTVEYCNIVLDGLEKLNTSKSDEPLRNQLKGAALFFRAFAFFNLVQSYARPYHAASGSADPGIPLRLGSDTNDNSVRTSIQQTYDRIFGDLKASLPLLPDQPQYQTRPSRAAVYALLSRICLSIADYGNAEKYADSTLAISNTLLDYNSLNAASSAPMPSFGNNREVIFYAENVGSIFLLGSTVNTDTALYRSYPSNDLRKGLYFINVSSSVVNYKGSYIGNSLSQFAGLAVNEVLLNKAESSVRNGNIEAGMKALNTLMAKRFRSASFVSFVASGKEEALALILAERRKELFMTGNLRWLDLRRLNMEPAFAVTLRRKLNGQEYLLAHGSPRYVFQIPDEEIALSGIAQNER